MPGRTPTSRSFQYSTTRGTSFDASTNRRSRFKSRRPIAGLDRKDGRQRVTLVNCIARQQTSLTARSRILFFYFRRIFFLLAPVFSIDSRSMFFCRRIAFSPGDVTSFLGRNTKQHGRARVSLSEAGSS